MKDWKRKKRNEKLNKIVFFVSSGFIKRESSQFLLWWFDIRWNLKLIRLVIVSFYSSLCPFLNRNINIIFIFLFRQIIFIISNTWIIDRIESFDNISQFLWIIWHLYSLVIVPSSTTIILLIFIPITTISSKLIITVHCKKINTILIYLGKTLLLVFVISKTLSVSWVVLVCFLLFISYHVWNKIQFFLRSVP